MDDLQEQAERAFMEARNNVSDTELVARINAAPDMGGAMLVELSEFMANRLEPVYVGIGDGVDRCGYTETDCLTMSDDEFDSVR